MKVKIQFHAQDKAENAIMCMIMDACETEVRDMAGSDYEFIGEAERASEILASIRKLILMRNAHKSIGR